MINKGERMNITISLLISCIILQLLSSCTPSPPYEIRSPCVSSETDNPYAINPCVRRPVNINHDIS